MTHAAPARSRAIRCAGGTSGQATGTAAESGQAPQRYARHITGVELYSFRFAEAYRRPARLFGVSPANSSVEVDADTLRARFGRWRVITPLANIRAVAITGPYAFLKTAGPARLAITDRGLTFATNGASGVLISFVEPVRGLEPTGLLRHPELTVTVADVDGLAQRLRSEIHSS